MGSLKRLGLACLSTLMLSGGVILPASAHEVPVCVKNCPAPRIQIALLLDTSNSMDGLIDQTKSQLWMLVNELGETRKNQMTPVIELALYEYGNTNIPVSRGYIREVMSLTTDLDAVSEQLFALSTKGGQEYAGQVISTAVGNLEWSQDPADMKLIIIAGNEPFTQGPVDFRTACEQARNRGILIDTIHCGDEKVGIDTDWRAGADCGGGIYMTIDQDDVNEFIASPYDDKILELNEALNKTYLGYGARGSAMQERLVQQDQNAASMGVSSQIARSKTKSSVQYRNEYWDVVDAYELNSERILNMDSAQLPEELKDLSPEERAAFIEQKSAERDKIALEIAHLERQRTEFVSNKRKDKAFAKTLEQVVVSAVKRQAMDFGFE